MCRGVWPEGAFDLGAFEPWRDLLSSLFSIHCCSGARIICAVLPTKAKKVTEQLSHWLYISSFVVPPSITDNILTLDAVEGTEATISCKAYGLPPPKFEFYKVSRRSRLAVAWFVSSSLCVRPRPNDVFPWRCLPLFAVFIIHAEHVVHRRGYCFHFGCMYVCMFVCMLAL